MEPTRTRTLMALTGATAVVAATVAATDIIRTRGEAPDARAKWTASWPLLAGFIGGCLIGAGGATLFSDHAALIPAVLAVALLIGVLVHRAGTKVVAPDAHSPLDGDRSRTV